MRKLLSGTWKAENYSDAVKRRSEVFDIKKRMFEIEALMDQ